MAEFKHLVRIANTDLKGDKQVVYAIKNIKGIGVSLANALCQIAKIPRDKKIGELSDSEIKKLDDLVKAPHKSNVPKWMLNRQKDLNTGEDSHLITNDLLFAKENDIKLLRKLKCYRGVRHALRLPVRGQKTRSNFRPNKGKVTGVKTAGKKRG
ncbi:30S ribosomal protein S13 [Candidatus Woesearchaeota archaeon]|nr:MAG: 30S ribosomal protein S13 [Candidatus Woesearchaeota archaeon]